MYDIRKTTEFFLALVQAIKACKLQDLPAMHTVCPFFFSSSAQFFSYKLQQDHKMKQANREKLG
jgi:hypothetical protein